MEGRPTLKKLLNGEVVEVQGIPVIMINEPIKAGDSYVAERNGPAQLLIAASVNLEKGWINPTGIYYCFDIGECIKVKMAE